MFNIFIQGINHENITFFVFCEHIVTIRQVYYQDFY